MYPIYTKVRCVLWSGEKVYRLDGFFSEDRRGKRSLVVCTESSNPDVVVMKSAKEGV